MADLSNSGKPWTGRAAAGAASFGGCVGHGALGRVQAHRGGDRDKRQEMARRARGQVSRYAVRRDNPLAA
jgi:hypothetical protein